MRSIYFAGGFLFLLIGAVGILLPILPTTPFVILAAYLFSKSSERFYFLLKESPFFGNIILDWERDRSISLQSKIVASFMIISVFGSSLFFIERSTWVVVLLLFVGSACLAGLWSYKTTDKTAIRNKSTSIEEL